MEDPPNQLPTSEDRDLLRDSVRGFLREHWPIAQALERSGRVADVRQITTALAAQGLCALGSDPEVGGMQEIIVVMEELGRAGCPAPLLASSLANLLFRAPPAADSRSQAMLDAVRLGEAWLALSLGALDGDRTACSIRRSADGRFCGELRYLDSIGESSHLLVILDERRLAIFELDPATSSIRPTRAFGTHGLSAIHLTNASARVLEFESGRLSTLVRLARLASVARAFGAARRSFEMSLEYAGERRQFGRAIGAFQAIAHKLASNEIALEGVRLSVANAASHHDRGLQSWGMLAASACAFASTALRRVSLETHHAFGAVGYAEEHEAPRHFKRTHLDVLRHGTGRRAREELAQHFLSEPNRFPEIDLGPAGNAFRQEVRDWLHVHWTPERQQALRDGPHPHRDYDPEFARELGQTGWIALHWPRRFGGQERSPLEYLAFVEEMERAGAPRAGAPIQAIAWMLFGTEAQQRRFLPEISRGEAVYGMWYSEPNSGSDLASLATTARRDGDEFVINGQKIWTTSYWGDYMWLAVRTDTEVTPKHAGISVLCVPTDTPGITIRPVRTMYDGEFVNTFFDDVRVPFSSLVGELNGGWKVLTESLGAERSIVGGSIVAKLIRSFEEVCAYVRSTEHDDRPLAQDPLVRDAMAAMAAEIEVARQLALHCVTLAGTGETPPHAAAITKVFAGELMERFFETAQDILGMEASLSAGSEGAILLGRLEQKLRHSLMWVISLGTNEIQRTLIATRGLGLPRK